MNLLDFYKEFPDEQSCKDYLVKLRLDKGIICKECQTTTKHYYLKSVEKFKCKECGSRTNLKTGTLLEHSKVPLQKWFMTIHLMTSIKKSFSSLELQKQLGFSRYEPILHLMRKIRKNMGQRDDKYQLNGLVELDHGHFVVSTKKELDEFGHPVKMNRGLGSPRQRPVLVMVEKQPRPQTKSYRKNSSMGYVKMIVQDDLKSSGVNFEVQKHINCNSVIKTDAATSFKKLNEVVKTHCSEVIKPKDAMKKLPWVHTVISNVKKQILGVHHSVKDQYLQDYLNEFCYKLNRRNFDSDLFDRFLVSSVGN